jgi:hypothetical protein
MIQTKDRASFKSNLLVLITRVFALVCSSTTRISEGDQTTQYESVDHDENTVPLGVTALDRFILSRDDDSFQVRSVLSPPDKLQSRRLFLSWHARPYHTAFALVVRFHAATLVVPLGDNHTQPQP